MRIAQNVEMLELPGTSGPMYPVLLREGRELVLVDSGLPGQLDLLRAAVAQAGWALGQITRLVITHQDIDHIGCARELAQLGATVLAHEQEAPYIQGDKPLIKLAAQEQRLPKLNEEQRAFYQRYKKGAEQSTVKVDRLLKDGDVLPLCGGVEIVHCPGHTPGHIALFLRGSGILLCGDAANIENGALVGADPKYTQDMELANTSLERLQALNPQAVVCYHGGYLPITRL